MSNGLRVEQPNPTRLVLSCGHQKMRQLSETASHLVAVSHAGCYLPVDSPVIRQFG